MNVDFHHRTRLSTGPRIEWVGPVWSHALLLRASFSRPLKPGYDVLNPQRLPHEDAAIRTDHLIRRGATTQADRSTQDEAILYDLLGDPERHPIVLLEVPGERAGESAVEELPTLTHELLAAWMRGWRAFPTLDEVETDFQQHELERLAAIDRALAFSPEELGSTDRDLLQQLLSNGLRRRLDHSLALHELAVYLHLFARGLDPRPFRVCERCLLVHRAPRAQTCPACRKSPPRPNPRPHHQKIFIGAGTPRRIAYQSFQGRDGASFRTSSQKPRVTTTFLYISTCAGCGNTFSATAANVKYCPSCAKPKARAARWRSARRSR